MTGDQSRCAGIVERFSFCDGPAEAVPAHRLDHYIAVPPGCKSGAERNHKRCHVFRRPEVFLCQNGVNDTGEKQMPSATLQGRQTGVPLGILLTGVDDITDGGAVRVHQHSDSVLEEQVLRLVQVMGKRNRDILDGRAALVDGL